MRRRLFLSLVLTASLFPVGPLGAADDDDDAPKFPELGSAIPGPFHVLNVTGKAKGRYHCLVCRHGLHPTVAVFVRPNSDDDMKIDDWLKKLDEDAPLAKLLKKLDAAVEKNTDAALGAYAIFIANDKEEVPVQTKLEKLPETLGLKRVTQAVADKLGQKQLEPWKLKPEAEVTVLLYTKHKVVEFKTFERDKLTDKDVDALAGAVEKLIPDHLRPGQKSQLKLKDK
jgi:hypothetical protein